eukprot:UN27078
MNSAYLNRWLDENLEGRPHKDIEPQSTGWTAIGTIGDREFLFSPTGNFNDPTKYACYTMGDRDILFIPPSLNSGPKSMFHKKGKGMSGVGTHFSIVGKRFRLVSDSQ